MLTNALYYPQHIHTQLWVSKITPRLEDSLEGFTELYNTAILTFRFIIVKGYRFKMNKGKRYIG